MIAQLVVSQPIGLLAHGGGDIIGQIALLLLIALLVIGVVYLRHRIRDVVPRPASILALFALLAGLIVSVASEIPFEHPSLLHSLWVWRRVLEQAEIGIAAGGFTGAFILILGFVYGDARRRGMPAVLWLLVALLVPNLLGFLLYFLLRRPLLRPCERCGAGIEPGLAFCPHCGHPQPAGAGSGGLTAAPPSTAAPRQQELSQ
jgi:hypothetical protein